MELRLYALVVASLVATVQGMEYQVISNATGTPGGMRFDREIGVDYAKQVMINASSFIWKTFRLTQNETAERASRVLLIVESMEGARAAQTISNVIHLNARYIAGFKGDVRTEVTGVLYHELAHVWLKWTSNAPKALVIGVADYVRLKAGYACADWAEDGCGERWDERPDVTARFLNYADSLDKSTGHGDFLHDLNTWMYSGSYDLLFVRLMGQTAYDIWKLYRGVGIPLIP